MNYDYFLELPVELKTRVVQKCYPIPYVRLRRSCRYLDEFCEKRKKDLGIYCRREPHLYLLNTWWNYPFRCVLQKYLDPWDDYDIPSPHLFIEYGKEYGSRNFMVPMTRGNTPEIRRSLSGFAFTHLTVNTNINGRSADELEFGEALVNLLDVAADFNIRNLTLCRLTTTQTEMLLKAYKSRKVTANFHYLENSLDVLRLVTTTDIQDITYYLYEEEHTPGFIDEHTIQKASWNQQDEFPIKFCYTFNLYDLLYYSFLSRWNELIPAGFTSFGYFAEGFTPFYANRPAIVEWQIWIKQDGNTWRIIDIQRSSYREYWEGNYSLQTATSKNELLLVLITFLQYFFPGYPLDFSGFYEILGTVESLELIQPLFEEYVKIINKCYRLWH